MYQQIPSNIVEIFSSSISILLEGFGHYLAKLYFKPFSVKKSHLSTFLIGQGGWCNDVQEKDGGFNGMSVSQNLTILHCMNYSRYDVLEFFESGI